MSTTIAIFTKREIEAICSAVFKVDFAETAFDGSFDENALHTFTGQNGEQVYHWQFAPTESATDVFSMQRVLFYKASNKKVSLEDGLTDEAAVQALLATIAQTAEIDLWWCYTTAPGAYVPSAILSHIPEFPRTELTLEEGCSAIYGTTSANLGAAFPLLSSKFPAADTSLLLYFGPGSLIWHFSANFGANGWSPVGDSVPAIRDLFRFRQADLSFQWQQGLPISWMLSGDLTIASYQLQASYLHPYRIIRASLSPTNTSNSSIKSFLETTLGMPAGATGLIANVLTAVDLSVYADLSREEIEFTIRNTTTWDLIGDFLNVSNMELRVCLEDGHFAEVELYLDLPLPIGEKGNNVLVGLEAAYDRSKSSPLWHFQADIEDSIAVGELINGLAGKFSATKEVVPDQLNDLFFENLSLSFDHQSDKTKFRFSGNVVYSGADRDVYLHVDIKVGKKDSKWKIDFETYILYAGYKFAINFEKSAGTVLVASLTTEDSSFNLTPFLKDALPGEFDLLIPDDLKIGIKNAFVAFYFPEKPKVAAGATQPPPLPSSKVFGLELSLTGSFDLTKVPGIGPLMGKADIALESMRIVGSAADLGPAAMAAIDGVLAGKNIPGLGATQPLEPKAGNVAFPKSIYLAAVLNLSGKTINLAHAIGKKPAKPATVAAAPAASGGATTTTAPAILSRAVDTGRAKPVQRVGQQFGPFLVESIGLSVQGGKFGLKFSGGIAMGPMDIQLINFTAVSSLNKFDPKFDLDGLAIGYDKPPLTVAGLLLKYEEEKTEDNKLTRTFGFRGGLNIGFKQVTISALGAYSQVKIYQPPDAAFHHSFHTFFLYGYLGAPLGGPPFFFVTGLALGVGFNMGLKIPPPEEFAQFPLTAAALKPAGSALTVPDMKAMLVSLDRFAPIREGSFWFAAGVKFETFKFLSGFLMLTLEFGDELEIGVLGIIEALLPASSPNPLIRLSLGFSVRVLPERGVVQAKGRFLPATFIFHEDVKIQGDMALLSIMKDQDDGDWAGARAGEFVFTLGGYGLLYKPKPYYPVVPALKLDWRVSNNLHISASAYFALTPEAIMLGGHLQGHFHYSKSIVRVDVDFKVALDFILYYQPLRYYGQASAEFHLKGSIEVDLGLFTIDKSLEMDASADLTIWGPEFSGKARLRLHFIVSFSVELSFGSDYQEPAPLIWTDFQESLLPKPDKVLNWSVVKGIVQESRERVIPTVNPYELSLLLDSQVPVKAINKASAETTGFGIKPMGVTAADFKSELTYTVYQGTENKTSEFIIKKKVAKNIPTAIWQPAATSGVIPKSDGNDLIMGAVCGLELIPVRGDDPVGISIEESTVADTLHGNVENVVGHQPYTLQQPAGVPSAAEIAAFEPA